ncbi:hypothetical protein [Fulvimonas yonginensis]|uniref:Uncharacterized protein n=1 Tax=Fulvimonas yonginensis TaxID=1495200 RepID=A0ABU8JAV2_9GAMM
MSKTIGQLDPAAALDGTETVEVEQAGVSARTTVDDIAARAGAASVGRLAGINDQTGTAYTVAAADAGKDIRCTNAAAIALNLDIEATSGITAGFWCLFSQGGAGAVTATALAGVDLRAPNGAATTQQDDPRGLEYLGGDVWRVL